MKTTVNEMIKSLFTEKTMAKLVKYQNGQIFYQFTLEGNTYEVAIDTVKRIPLEGDAEFILMSEDLGNTPFVNEIRASELTRWIKPAALTSQLRKV